MLGEYLNILKDPAHWLFEITLILLFDVIIGLIVWPKVTKILKHLEEHK